MTMDNDFRRRQEAQIERFQTWKDAQGTIELPTSLATMFLPEQKARMDWLKTRRRGRTLELGSNIGVVMAWTGADVGVDINPVNVDIAKILVPDRLFVCADIRLPLPFKDQDFETVMLPEVLEHLDFKDELPDALEEAVRISSTRVLITLPDGRFDTPEATCFKHRWLADERSVQVIRDLLRGMGARVSRTDVLQKFICLQANFVG